MFRLIFAFFLGVFGLGASAEPWISNRYAQNCASCHAPSRINVPASERRCTLSCQGCHVNPQGGGLRSYYGVWNQRRWLRSFYADSFLTEKKRPAPFKNQLYASSNLSKTPATPATREVEDLAALSAIAQHNARPARQARPKASTPAARAPRNGFPTVVWERNDYDEGDYDRSDGSEKTVASSREEFLQRVTADDPYREERRSAVSAGGDFRLMALAPTDSVNNAKQGIDIWLMNVDLGVRLRPIPEHLRVVFEARSMAGPTKKAVDQAFTAEALIRSAYVLIDDLPYNSYFQYGIYRPMFGNYDGNHLSLSAMVTGLNQRSRFLAASIGASPNVPFVNFSYITPMTDIAADKSRGFVATLGGRWVTLGASAAISYWSTTAESAAGNTTRKMVALTGGMKLGNAIVNGEILYVNREVAAQATDAGNTITVELRYKLWREIFAEASFAASNTSPNLKPGDARQYMLGARGFLLSGIDIQTLYFSRRFTENGVAGGYDGLQMQAHLYF